MARLELLKQEQLTPGMTAFDLADQWWIILDVLRVLFRILDSAVVCAGLCR